MNKVAAFALRRKNSILSMSEKMFCPPQPLRFWITPACAGKRRSDWIIRSIYWDHPRMCGEKLGKISAPNIGQGSPPRMRGKDTQLPVKIAQDGITPACAGKSGRHALRHVLDGDHPRVCGEKISGDCFFRPIVGSPPRMRGKDTQLPVKIAQDGITPACAGKSGRHALRHVLDGDHPRVCGEKISGDCFFRPIVGSPPRMRGKEFSLAGLEPHARITPACAGKSCPVPSPS